MKTQTLPFAGTPAGTAGTPEAGRSGRGRAAALLPGLVPVSLLAAAATFAGGVVPVVGAPVLAIVGGLVVATLRPLPERAHAGVSFTARQVLQGSVVLLGTGLSLAQVLAAGERSLPVLVATLGATFTMAWLATRALGLRRDLGLLIGVGTAICGASAIAATDAVIGADEADVSYAIATIFAFNIVAVLTYPELGHLLGMSQHAFGLLAGTAINDTSSVVAAATVYGHAAASYGVVVKLTRTLALVPVSLVLAAWRRRQERAGPLPTAGNQPAPAPAGVTMHARRERGRGRLAGVFPWFVLGFLGAVVVGSSGLVPAGGHRALSDLATWAITAALAAVGLSARPARMRAAGARPMVLGAVLWATVGATSLACQLL